MTTTERPNAIRQVYFHDATAPEATAVVPSAFVAVRGRGGRLLLVRRCDSGTWEMPGGRVDVGETAVDAAVRETWEEAGVHVEVTGLVGLFSDPGHVIRSSDGETRQQFALVFRGRTLGGLPHGDLHETSDAAWVTFAELPGLDIEPPVRGWIAHALAFDEPPCLA
jgi:8-oxo-dGTP diphosphatase